MMYENFVALSTNKIANFSKSFYRFSKLSPTIEKLQCNFLRFFMSAAPIKFEISINFNCDDDLKIN